MDSKFFKYVYQTNRYFSKINGSVRCFPNPIKLKLKINSDCQRAYSKCDDKKKQDDNLAAVLHQKNDLKMEKMPIPTIKSDQVLVQIETVGIGASDVHFFKHLTGAKPTVLGHEASGTVVECGKHVHNLKPGDKVAIEPQAACKNCFACKLGHSNLCKKAKYCGSPPHNGVLCRYFAAFASSCHKMPCDLNFEQGSLLQPLSEVLHVFKRIKLTAGDSVLVSSSNVSGLFGILVAQLSGTAGLAIIGHDDHILKRAKELGATCALNIKGKQSADVKNQLEKEMGHLPNKTVEYTGDEEAIATSLCSTKSGGELALKGTARKDVMSISVPEIVTREVNVKGCHKSSNEYPKAMAIVASGVFDPRCLVSHHFRLEEVPQAFEFAAKKTEPFLKIMIHCNPEWKKERS